MSSPAVAQFVRAVALTGVFLLLAGCSAQSAGENEDDEADSQSELAHSSAQDEPAADTVVSSAAVMCDELYASTGVPAFNTANGYASEFSEWSKDLFFDAGSRSLSCMGPGLTTLVIEFNDPAGVAAQLARYEVPDSAPLQIEGAGVDLTGMIGSVSGRNTFIAAKDTRMVVVIGSNEFPSELDPAVLNPQAAKMILAGMNTTLPES